MFRINRFIAVALLLLIPAAAGGLYAWRQHERYSHYAVHEPGMIYRSAWLEPDVIADLVERHQLRTVVNLCRPDEMGLDRWEAERHAVRDSGARLMELSMPTSVSARDADIRGHVEALSNPDNYPMLVHCQHGVTRTAKFLAIYDIAFRGMTARESLAAQPKFGRERHNVHIRAFADNFEREHTELFRTAGPQRLNVLRR